LIEIYKAHKMYKSLITSINDLKKYRKCKTLIIDMCVITHETDLKLLRGIVGKMFGKNIIYWKKSLNYDVISII